MILAGYEHNIDEVSILFLFFRHEELRMNLECYFKLQAIDINNLVGVAHNLVNNEIRLWFW